MDAVDVHRLGASDVVGARRMLDVLGAAFEDSRSYGDHQPDDAYLAGVLGDDAVVALAAYDGEQVVGGLIAYELRKLEQARSELYLYDLGVAESHRRRGIATALIDRLRALARDRGAHVVFVQADLGDDPAIALYARLGQRADVLHFDIPPSPEAPDRT